ncbi:MAG: anti-sigma factor [Panacagrimonas sp.]
MIYRKREQRELLAAEYVLGTLSGRARRRFERQLARRPELQAEVEYWEARLAHFARLDPVTPPDDMWQRIEQAVDQRHVRVVPLRRPVPPPQAPVVNHSPKLALWRTWAILATAASLVMAVALGLQMRPRDTSSEVAQNKDELYIAPLGDPYDGQWVVSMTPETRQVRVAAGGSATVLMSNYDYEMWWWNEDGPVSLGLLPRSGQIERSLPPQVALSKDGQVAVSLERAGGSKTGRPNGPVIMATPVFVGS